uniref:39S ribosomal protein L50, mitochondrial n=1 Tax=Angiostrongylus cantonensis TaxID=6313 RepID=A0A0K0DMC5_ANGCA
MERGVQHSGSDVGHHLRGASSILVPANKVFHPSGFEKLVPDLSEKKLLSAMQLRTLQPGYLRTPGRTVRPATAFYDIQDEIKIIKQQPKPHVKLEDLRRYWK